ncbi:CsgE family curli-type amyloid fiber assembly protein [Chryseobacterium sp. T1]
MFNLCFITFLSLPIFLFSQIEKNNNVKANLDVKKEENVISIKAKAINNDDIIHDLNYLLISVKQSASGNLSNNKQDGKFIINPDETKELSEIVVNSEPDDQIKIYLFIRNERENLLISKDSVFINITNENDILSLNTKKIKKEEVKEEDYSLKGLVIDNTKSKIGKDFFELFYSKYNQLSDQFAFVITVSELPSFGRNGVINIDVGDRSLHSFRVVPNDDYIAAQVQLSLRFINNYDRENKLINKELRAP